MGFFKRKKIETNEEFLNRYKNLYIFDLDYVYNNCKKYKTVNLDIDDDEIIICNGCITKLKKVSELTAEEYITMIKAGRTYKRAFKFFHTQLNNNRGHHVAPHIN